MHPPSPIRDLVDLVVAKAKEDPEFATALRHAAEAVLSHLDAAGNAASPSNQDVKDAEPTLTEARSPRPGHDPAPGRGTAQANASSHPPALASEGDPAMSPSEGQPVTQADLDQLRERMLEGGSRGDMGSVPYAGSGPVREPATDAILAPLVTRFRLKAMAARWHADGAEPRLLPALRSKFGEIAGLDTILQDRSLEGSSEAWGRLADAYEAAGTAADVLATFADTGHALSSGTPFAEAVIAAAEAQSAVRAAYWALRGQRADEVSPRAGREDPDQVDLFQWLREATGTGGVLVERHMRWKDPADPAGAGAVQRRLRTIAEEAELRVWGDKPAVEAPLNAAKYHASLLSQHPERWDAEHQRERLLDSVGAAVEAGVPPTDLRLRALLSPIAGLLPDADDPTLTPKASRVLTALYDYVYGVEADANETAATPASPPPHIEEAARLLTGKRLALFGGIPRPKAEGALVDTLGLAGVEWVETQHHQSTAPFEAVVARNDIAVQLIRWTAHSAGDLRELCMAHRKLLVRAPGGYNPSAIAQNVLDQISDDLRQRG